jgi:transcriptional regulator with XRE-family HTH domain
MLGSHPIKYRHRLGFSQQEVAKMAGIYASDLSKMEREEKSLLVQKLS